MIIHIDNHREHTAGGKAHNLFRLAEHGCPVPPFFCVDERFDEKEVLRYLEEHFPETGLFSVRSSASAEDGEVCSFAGQFRTFLRVQRKEVCNRIREVLSSAREENVLRYCRIHDTKHMFFSMYVIVQEMVEADASGILFTANPQGILNETVIVLGSGTGDQVVEDRADTTTYYYNQSDQLCYYEQTGDSPLLTETQFEELIRVSGQIRQWFRAECDLEYAFQDQKLWILQVRPITTFQKDAPVIVLDNSNIVESYPGITLPLTQSFIREAYYQVFKNLLLRLTGEPETVQKIDDVLRHMVDMANGRVYYRISSWYDVLLFLPFSKRIIPIWQEMMGVGDRAVSSSLQGKIRRRTRLKVARSFFRLLLTCPKEMDRLDQYFSEIIRRFEIVDMDTRDNRILMDHYHSLLQMTVERWDMTLVNDMYSFLFTGLLKAYLRARHVPDPERAANRAISGIRKLESLGPIRELERLAREARFDGRIGELQMIRTNEDYARYVRESKDAYAGQLEDYIQRFGDRNVEELKLESKTFRTDPVLLVQRILRYAKEFSVNDKNFQSTAKDDLVNDCTLHTTAKDNPADDHSLHTTAKGAPVNDCILHTTATNRSCDSSAPLNHDCETTDHAGNLTGSVKGKTDNSEKVRITSPLPNRFAAFLAKHAALGIRNREKSRLHRSRLYGMMRTLAIRMGQNLYAQGQINQPDDIFWLECDEIERAAAEPDRNLQQIIIERKKEYDGFRTLPAWSRLIFSGKIRDRHPKTGRSMAFQKEQGIFHGTACSPGISEGEVLLVHQPSLDLDTRDRILVTRMTDPGWVFLIADARAIVSEKGSLLSHTAIISRELKKPAVVGIPHIMETLKDGDRVRVDGDSGTVTLI